MRGAAPYVTSLTSLRLFHNGSSRLLAALPDAPVATPVVEHVPRLEATRFQRERIGKDGELIMDGLSVRPPPSLDGTRSHTARSRLLAATAPVVNPPTADEIEALADFVQSSRGRLCVLTGAGASTESKIPDYRGTNGAYSTGTLPEVNPNPAPSFLMHIPDIETYPVQASSR